MPNLKSIAFLLMQVLYLSSFGQTGFTENKGQFHDNVLYEAEFHQFKIYIDKQGLTVLLHDQESWIKKVEEFHQHENQRKFGFGHDKLGFHAIKIHFEGGDLRSHSGEYPYDFYSNYFIGNDESRWASGVKTYQKVLFREVYPGIDLEFVALDQRFKYNFIVHPGADLSKIKIAIEGEDYLKVESNQLKIGTRFGELIETMPLTYYSDEKQEQYTVQSEYVESNGLISYKVMDEGSGDLVVDPELIFSTYAGNTVDNFGFTATYDQSGNLYAGGIATSASQTIPNGRYPATPGAFDQTYNGGTGESPANLPCDISISKYNSTGTTLIYATYLGGEGDEYPHSLVVDDQNQLIVFGTSRSSFYPTFNSPPQGLKKGGTDLIVTKFNSNCTGLIGSTYLGGGQDDGLNSSNLTKYFYADDFRGEVNLDTTTGRIFVATTTMSDDFITTNGTFGQSDLTGQDGIILCLSPDLSTLIWSSYFGGSGADAIYSVDIDANGDLYISGGTSSTDLQETGNGYQTANAGGRTDGFIAKISNDGTSIINCTYYGTSNYDQILSLEIDKYGNIFVVGQSSGGIESQGNVAQNAGSGQFITKFNNSIDEVLLVTVYGSGRTVPDITVNAFLVDECDKIFVSGWGGSLYHGPQTKLSNMPITPDAIQSTTDGNDFHLIVFRKDMKEILYGTYFGGDLTDDHVDGGTSRFDKRGVIYQSVCSSCPPTDQQSQVSDFPTTDGAYAEKNLSPRCSNASFKLAFGNLNRPPNLTERTFRVNALDTLNFSYLVNDPDEDTIKVWYTYPDDKVQYFITKPDFKRSEAIVTGYFSFNPDCSLIGDTITVEVYAQDIGCPGIKDSTQVFHIIVDPPPLLPPPGVICLNFLAKDALRIDWEPTEYSKYFSKMYLYKIWPNGTTKLINTYYTQDGGSYTDADVIAPRSNNYTYYLVVENKCGMVGVKSYDLSSVKESEIPVEPTYLKTVTVVDSVLKIEWLKSNEPDFGHYEIYKFRRGSNDPEYVTSISDVDSTYYFDKKVDVDNVSYCYQIRVSDDCGHLSVLSNMGCSIVIRGDAPQYYFNLYWDSYIDWAGGVLDYQLIRSVDTGTLRPIVRVPDTLYSDHDLDLDWGGYWYSVIAYEGAGGQDATSRSNDIYLIQPPLVFVPNAVTANSDGLNDYFGWSDAFVLDFKMTVYNRWGQKVYETTDKNASWDGFFRENDPANSNVYVWIVEYTGWDRSKHMKKGTVTFLR